MPNLPAQAHSQAVAVTQNQDAYQIDQSMVKLPSLYLAQYQSKAFKSRLAEFGDIYVALGAEDPEPQVVGLHGDGGALSAPVRFYAHTAAPGYQVVDKDAPFGKRSLRLGTPYAQAIREGGGDPRNVFLQTHYTLTIPAYELWPVRFIMGSKWGGNASRWINSQIAIAQQKGENPLDLAFQIQTRPTSSESGDFVDAVVGFAKVAAKDKKADLEIVERHADLLSSGSVDTSFEVDEPSVATEAPSLA
jgi:hypothetical protein